MEQENLGVLACLPVAQPSTAQCRVGRTREIAVLEAALTASRGGQGQLVLLEGRTRHGQDPHAAGVGSVRGRPRHAVLWGRCYEGEGAPPFWPWIQIIRSYLTSTSLETLQAEIGAGAAALAQVMPEIRQRLADSAQPASIGASPGALPLL